MAHDPQERTAPAAEADVLGEEARNSGTLVRLQRDERGAAGGESPAAQGDNGEARPGQDENQAGFVKDPDKRFRP